MLPDRELAIGSRHNTGFGKSRDLLADRFPDDGQRISFGDGSGRDESWGRPISPVSDFTMKGAESSSHLNLDRAVRRFCWSMRMSI